MGDRTLQSYVDTSIQAIAEDGIGGIINDGGMQSMRSIAISQSCHHP